MIKNLLVYTILVSMALHCGCRLGVLDHLYQNRHRIAHAIGLLAEIPIALCSSDYDDGVPHIQIHEETQSVPQALLQAKEINLFFISAYIHPILHPGLLLDKPSSGLPDLYDLLVSGRIFHPPSCLA